MWECLLTWLPSLIGLLLGGEAAALAGPPWAECRRALWSLLRPLAACRARNSTHPFLQAVLRAGQPTQPSDPIPTPMLLCFPHSNSPRSAVQSCRCPGSLYEGGGGGGLPLRCARKGDCKRGSCCQHPTLGVASASPRAGAGCGYPEAGDGHSTAPSRAPHRAVKLSRARQGGRRDGYLGVPQRCDRKRRGDAGALLPESALPVPRGCGAPTRHSTIPAPHFTARWLLQHPRPIGFITGGAGSALLPAPGTPGSLQRCSLDLLR